MAKKKQGLAPADEPTVADTKKMVSDSGNEAQGYQSVGDEPAPAQSSEMEIVDEEYYMRIDPRTSGSFDLEETEEEELEEEKEEKKIKFKFFNTIRF